MLLLLMLLLLEHHLLLPLLEVKQLRPVQCRSCP
jgi:hypothetical protein